MKGIYEEPTANIILNGERIDTFPLRRGIRQRFPLTLLFNIVQKALPVYDARKKLNKRHPDWKWKSKAISIPRWQDLMYIKHYRIHNKTIRAKKQVQKMYRIKD